MGGRRRGGDAGGTVNVRGSEGGLGWEISEEQLRVNASINCDYYVRVGVQRQIMSISGVIVYCLCICVCVYVCI